MTDLRTPLAAARTARRRSVVLAAILGMLVSFAVVLPTATAHADGGLESAFVTELNRERSAAGLASLSTAGDLIAVARAHSGVMAGQDHLHHNPNLGSDVGGWQKVGENVGRGPNVSALHTAFMDSPGHRKNIMDPDWTEVGIGVVVVDKTVWVTVVFRKPQGASAPPPPPEPESAAEPDPEPAASTDGAGSGGSAEAANGGTRATDTNDAAGAGAAGGSGTGEQGDAASAPTDAATPHEVIEQPLPLDRVTLFLAREEAAERFVALEDVLEGVPAAK